MCSFHVPMPLSHMLASFMRTLVRRLRPHPRCACRVLGAESFDFKTYMVETASVVNDALDKAIPAKYPEKLNDSMR